MLNNDIVTRGLVCEVFFCVQYMVKQWIYKIFQFLLENIKSHSLSGQQLDLVCLIFVKKKRKQEKFANETLHKFL